MDGLPMDGGSGGGGGGGGGAGGDGAGDHGPYHREIDTCGLSCPLPILRAKKALADMQSGQVLKVVSTDPGSVRDFQAFARQTGNVLLGQSKSDKEFLHYLRRR